MLPGARTRSFVDAGSARPEPAPQVGLVPAQAFLRAMTARVFLCLIPVQAGIQWLLRGARLDPGPALRAVRDDIKEKERAGWEDARKYARHRPFAVIPAEAWIQWLLRDARLDPGPALRAVRDDGAGSALRAGREDSRKKGRIVREGGIRRGRILGWPLTPADGAWNKCGEGEVCMVVVRGTDQPPNASSRARSASRRKSPAAPGETRAARLASGVRPTPDCAAASAALR